MTNHGRTTHRILLPTVTSSLLHDDRSNHLLILTLPNEKLQALEAQGRLNVTLTGVDTGLSADVLGHRQCNAS